MATIDKIAKQVAAGLSRAGMTRKATLTVVSKGIRVPGSVSAGTNPTTEDISCKGLVITWSRKTLAQTNVESTDRVVMLLGATLAGHVPKANDRITIESVESTIVAVERDAAGAAYNCLTR